MNFKGNYNLPDSQGSSSAALGSNTLVIVAFPLVYYSKGPLYRWVWADLHSTHFGTLSEEGCSEFWHTRCTSFPFIMDPKSVVTDPPVHQTHPAPGERQHRPYTSRPYSIPKYQPISPASGIRTLSNLLPPLLLLSPNQLLDETHCPLLLQSPRILLVLSDTLPPFLLGLRINTVLSVAVVVHRGMFIEADCFQTSGRVAEFI